MTRATFRWVVGSVIVGLMLSVPGHVLFGQGRQGRDRGRPKQQQPSGPPVETSGIIDAVMPGYIKMTTPTNQVWILRISPDAKVTVNGEAKLDAVKPGVFVAFSGEVDKRHSVIEEKIGKLTIVTPNDLRPVGAFPSQGGGFAALHNQLTAGGAGAGAAPAAGEARGGAAGNGAATERFDIVGQFMGVNKKGKASVVVPNPYFKPNLSFEIAEDVAVDLDLANPTAYMLAKKGDKIEAKGKQFAMTGALATELTIYLVEPLTAAQPDKKAARTARGKKSDDDEPEAKADEKDGKDEKANADDEKDDDGDKNVRKRTSRRTSRTSKRGEDAEEAAAEPSEEKAAAAEEQDAGKAKKGEPSSEKPERQAGEADKKETADEEK